MTWREQSGVEVRNRKKRAEELLTIISDLGPAIIKAGQALSSRPDLLPKEYLDELQKLQVCDHVCVFGTLMNCKSYRHGLVCLVLDFKMRDDVRGPAALRSCNETRRR